MGHQDGGKNHLQGCCEGGEREKKSIIVLPVATSFFVSFFMIFLCGTPGVFAFTVTEILIPSTYPSVVTPSLEHFPTHKLPSTDLV
jgi:hypothetical protein